MKRPAAITVSPARRDQPRQPPLAHGHGSSWKRSTRWETASISRLFDDRRSPRRFKCTPGIRLPPKREARAGRISTETCYNYIDSNLSDLFLQFISISILSSLSLTLPFSLRSSRVAFLSAKGRPDEDQKDHPFSCLVCQMALLLAEASALGVD
jgi:hypothetical protein